MKNKFVYFLVGALLTGLAIVMFQVTQASPAHPNPGHGTSQIEGDADLNMNNYKIINLKDPTSDQDATTKAYVDGYTATLSCHIVSEGGDSYRATATCASGVLTGGGCYQTASGTTRWPEDGYPSGNSWACRSGSSSGRVKAYAVCCEII